jgi:hypothetical protein
MEKKTTIHSYEGFLEVFYLCVTSVKMVVVLTEPDVVKLVSNKHAQKTPEFQGYAVPFGLVQKQGYGGILPVSG